MSFSDHDPGAHAEPSPQELVEVERTMRDQESPLAGSVQQLLELGRKRGYVTTLQVRETLQESDDKSEQLDEIYSELFEAGIEVKDWPAAPAERAAQPVLEDPMRIYLQEIRRVPLLSAAQEAKLAHAIAQARLACKVLLGEEARRSRAEAQQMPGSEPREPGESEARAAAILEAEECARRLRRERPWTAEELQGLVSRGEEAGRRLAVANLRLVVHVAIRYVGWGMPLLDLIQEGNVGLLHAVEKFDASKKCRFSTYAIWWIRHAIMRALADQSRTIRVPGHIVQIIHRLSHGARRLQQQLGREALPAELSEEIGLPEELVLAVLKASKEPLSLEMPFGEDEDGQLKDFIEDQKSIRPEQAASHAMLREQLHLALAALTKKEREILTLRFGLLDGHYHTLEEVGRSLGIPRERARQMEGRALRKLRHPTLCTRLRDFVES